MDAPICSILERSVALTASRALVAGPSEAASALRRGTPFCSSAAARSTKRGPSRGAQSWRARRKLERLPFGSDAAPSPVEPTIPKLPARLPRGVEPSLGLCVLAKPAIDRTRQSMAATANISSAHLACASHQHSAQAGAREPSRAPAITVEPARHTESSTTQFPASRRHRRHTQTIQRVPSLTLRGSPRYTETAPMVAMPAMISVEPAMTAALAASIATSRSRSVAPHGERLPHRQHPSVSSVPLPVEVSCPR
jgi:hypothetical protein